MSKYQIGDIVNVVNHRDPFKVINVQNVVGIYGWFDSRYLLKSLYTGMELSTTELDLIPGQCPVCLMSIERKNNLIQMHYFQNEVCYGSFTPW